MKRCMWFCALVCALLIPLFVWAQGWVWQNPRPQGNSFHDICQMWTDYGGTGWLVGDAGTLMYTNNCTGFGLRPNLGRSSLMAVAMSDVNHAWIVGSSPSVIYYTMDGGQNWVQQIKDTSYYLRDMVFTDAMHGWAVGNGRDWASPGVVLRTTNAGYAWISDTVASYNGLSAVSFVDNLHGWIAGDHYVGRTTDGGLTWQEVDAPDWTCQDLVFTDSQTGFFAGILQVFKTVDAGQTWLPSTEMFPTWIVHLEFVGSDLGWVTGNSGLLYHTTDAGESWNAQTTNTNECINSIHFFDYPYGQAVGDNGLILWTNNGGDHWLTGYTNVAPLTTFSRVSCAPRNTVLPQVWAVGSDDDGSVIVHSSDGGEHWTRQSTPWTGIFHDVAAINADSAFVVGDYGGIFLTTNGGQNWLPQYSGTTYPLARAYFVNSRVGWVGSGSNELLHTTDAGIHWTTLHDEYSHFLFDMSFVSENTGWMASGGYPWSGELRRTTDGGVTWESQFVSADTTFFTCYFIDVQNGWVGGVWAECEECEGYSVMLHTTDGGSTWEPQTVPATSEIEDVLFADYDRGWCLADGRIFVTNNGGRDWVSQELPTAQRINALSNFDHQNVWAVGTNSAILHGNGTTSSAPATHTEQPEKFTLSAYPNPFNPRTTIRFDVPTAAHTELLVFDVTGRLAVRLYEGRMPAGQHEIAFDASALPSGIYFANLRSGSHVTTRKLVLLK